jgi:5'-nucleotidase
MDDVIADLEARITKLWEELHPEEPLFPNGRREKYYIGASLNDSERLSDIWHLLHGPNLFSSLDPVEGSLEALDTMLSDGHEVFIVTSAGVSFPLAATEKYQWVKEHCGEHMLSHLVITPSKFLVIGDILIDDKPELYREDEAKWEHVLFDKPYNQNSPKRRLTWQNWQEFVTKEV